MAVRSTLGATGRGLRRKPDISLAKELLGQHRARQKVGPGGRAEAEQQVGAAAPGIAVTIRRTEKEAALALAAVSPAFEPLGKVDGRKGLAALIEHHGHGCRGAWRDGSASVRQFGDLSRPGDSGEIPLDQFGFGRSGDLAAGDDVQEHLLQ